MQFRREREVDASTPAITPVPPTSAASGGATDVILVKTGFKQVATRIREIVYVEAARNYCRLHLENGQVLKSRIPIDRLAQHLGPGRFLRIHRGSIVNIDRIRTVTTLLGGRLLLTLADGSKIAVARDRRRAVLAEIGITPEPRSRAQLD
jgi:two-component system LytT family response regulator